MIKASSQSSPTGLILRRRVMARRGRSVLPKASGFVEIVPSNYKLFHFIKMPGYFWVSDSCRLITAFSSKFKKKILLLLHRDKRTVLWQHLRSVKAKVTEGLGNGGNCNPGRSLRISSERNSHVAAEGELAGPDRKRQSFWGSK